MVASRQQKKGSCCRQDKTWQGHQDHGNRWRCWSSCCRSCWKRFAPWSKTGWGDYRQRLYEYAPDRLIGDKAYDSDKLDQQLSEERAIELIAPHKRNRKKRRTQDGRKLRRYRRRWKVERLFAWLQNFRRLVVRYEYHVENFLALVQLGCSIILLRLFWDDL